jgi:hypothetical protein
MSHFCEFDVHTNGKLGLPECGAPAVAKRRGKWYCDDHLESMEAHAGLMDVLDEFEREGEGE